MEMIRNKKSDILTFVIPGNPISKQSLRVSVQTNKDGSPVLELTKNKKTRVKIYKYQPKNVQNDSAYIKWCFASQRPFGFELWSSPIAVLKLHFIFSHTKESKKLQLKLGDQIIYKNSKPDLQDNLSKALFDAMNGIIFFDDKQIVSMDNVKKYFGDTPQTILTIRKLQD